MLGDRDDIKDLASGNGVTWAALQRCRQAAEAERSRIRRLVEKDIPADCSFLVFGSLARDEYTNRSDIDWALLIDGAASPQHLDIAQKIARELGNKQPGPTQVFGCPIFSHDLVHLIGGQADTNSNTTRRILLLLESRALIQGEDVRGRVLRHLLRRYVGEDRGYHTVHNYDVRIPRFLLNDIVRYWRTMGVDYATKRRERGSAGWAIRNIKLRMSRKLIFAAGLAMCLSCQLRPSQALAGKPFANERDFTDALQDFLFEFANRTPLQILTRFAISFGAESAAVKCLEAYDAFLDILSDDAKRERLNELGVEDAFQDDVFLQAREIGTSFQEGLTRLFFESDTDLTVAVQRYGVF